MVFYYKHSHERQSNMSIRLEVCFLDDVQTLVVTLWATIAIKEIRS